MERPKLGNDDDEEDLLRFQEEFLASKAKPSVNIIKKSEKRKSAEPARDVVHMDALPSAPPSLDVQPPKKSRFRAEREKKGVTYSQQTATAPEPSTSDPDFDPEEMLDREDKSLASVIGSIIERDTRNATFTMPRQSPQAFPLVIKSSNFTKSTSQRKTLFAQEVAQRGVQEFGVVPQEEADQMEISKPISSSESAFCRQDGSQQAPQQSNIVDGHGLSISQAEEEAKSIHKENLAKLADMSEQEILAEQQQLLQALDPRLVEFLKSKSASGKAPADQSKPRAAGKKAKSAQKKQPTQSEDVCDLPEAALIEEGGKKWVHMDKVEYDKLEWMKDLPPPSAGDAETGQQARFDFKGNLLPADALIPVQKGLHHHGEEPEKAGYSIGELFQLARSTNIQQRVLALTTLGNVINKAKGGCLDDLLQTPIIPSILDAGVIFLLRWACDDTVDAVVAAALSALCALLCNPADEAALDRVSSWYQGNTVPALVPPATLQQMEENKMEVDDDKKVQETDAEMAKRDLIQALVSRMMLLERMFYILDSRRPQVPTVVCILSILTRVARHSTQMAYEIARNTRLINLIFENFLPTEWVSEASELKAASSAYGRPLPFAVRLVGSLCQAGRHIAASLTSTYALKNLLMAYLCVRTNRFWLSVKEADSLQKESLITWKILLSYGWTADVYIEIYHILMTDQLKDVTSRVSDMTQNQPGEGDVLFISALEGVLPVAAIPPVKPGFSQSEAAQTKVSVTSPVNWSHVEGLRPLVQLCAEQCLTHLAQNYTQQKSSLQFPAACLNFMATFYSKGEGMHSHSAVDTVQQVEQFVLSSLVPFLKSWGFTSIVTNLCSSSALLLSSESKRRNVESCLPELGCDECEGRMPVLGEHSPVGFLLALCRLVHCLCKVHKGVSEQTAAVILSHSDIMSYLRKVTTCSANHLHNNHFAHMETLLQYFLIKLSLLVSVASRPAMMHQLALDVMSRLQEGDEILAHDLTDTILFTADFIPEGKEEELATASMADLKISRTHILKSATQEEITTNNCQLLRESFAALPVIRACYFRAFAHMEGKVAQSRCRYQQLPQDTASLIGGMWESSLMPQDWVFLPLVDLYNRFLSVKSSSQKAVEMSSVNTVSKALQWIFLLEMWRPRALAHVSVTLKVSRLMFVFLGGDQLFLEKSVYPYLASLFRLYTTPRLLSAMNFEEKIPGISFYDIYMQLLEQFEGVSYGDPVFAAYVLLPMQQCQSCLLRSAVWQERSLMLRAMTIPVQEMLIDMDRFLSPEEADQRLLQLYTSSLVSRTVRQCWSPVFFLVAVHHLSRFLFYTQDDAHQDLRQSLWDMVLKCPDQSVKELIIHFKQVNTQVADCTETYTQLPANRQEVLNHHQQRLGVH